MSATIPVMTAAHAYEYEVPEHSPAPVEAVEQAESGNVVYLTRRGQRVAAVVPPAVAEHHDLDDVETFWESQERQVVAACRRMWAAVAGDDEGTRAAMRQSIDRILSTFEDSADAAIAQVALESRPTGRSHLDWEQTKRDFNL